jgi:hypothetical protein
VLHVHFNLNFETVNVFFNVVWTCAYYLIRTFWNELFPFLNYQNILKWVISLSELSEHFEMSYFPLWIIRTFWNELFPFMTYLQFIQEKAYITFSGLYAFVHYKLSSPPFYWFYWKSSLDHWYQPHWTMLHKY